MTAQCMSAVPLKRHLDGGVDSETKRVKDDTVDGMLDAVTAALGGKLARLDSSQEMLLAMAKGCLLTPSDQRHKYQTAVADMLHEVFGDMEEKAKLSITDAAAAVDRIVNRRSLLSNERSAAQDSLTTRSDALNEAKSAFCQDNIALQAAHKALAEARKVQAKEDAAVKQASANKDALEAALRDHYPLLSTAETAAELGKHVDAIVAVSEKVKLEEPLVKSFAAAALKMPNDRGTFNVAVIKQLQGELLKQSGKLDEVVAAGEPGVTSRAAKAAEAETQLQAARERQRKSAAALRSLDLDRRDGHAQVWDAKEAERCAEEELLHAENEQINAEGDLEEFRSGPRAALKVLASRQSAPAVLNPAESVSAEFAAQSE